MIYDMRESLHLSTHTQFFCMLGNNYLTVSVVQFDKQKWYVLAV